MKLAITADIHLRSSDETPGRYLALADVFRQAVAAKATTVLICGDLFDADFHNYADFEKLASIYPKLNLWILPGNHDSTLSTKSLAGKNIRIFEKPEVIGDGLKFLLIPYIPGKTMGEVIAAHTAGLEARAWVLCAHGDWLEGRRSPNLYEPGIYMPLTRSDLDRYQPAQVFLGHIHARRDKPIHYPGSPCGLDISETGRRRFLLFDTEKNLVESRTVETEVTFQSCTLTILPVEDEADYLHDLAAGFKQRWDADQPDPKKTVIRVKVQGVTQDRSSLLKYLQKEFKDYQFYNDEDFDTSELNTTVDPNRIHIAESVREKIEALPEPASPDEPSREQVLMQSLRLIFDD